MISATGNVLIGVSVLIALVLSPFAKSRDLRRRGLVNCGRLLALSTIMFAISMSSHSVIFAGAGYVLSAVGALFTSFDVSRSR
jgi:hypothetical protein